MKTTAHKSKVRTWRRRELATARRAGWRPGRKANSTLRTVALVRRTVGKNGGRFS
jgi:hypothetical protein